MISLKDVLKLAELSRMALTPEEIESLRKDMDSILGYVEQINKVSASLSVNNKAPLLRNIMREDGESHESGIFTEILLSAAPSREGQYVKVKKIL